MAVAGRKPKPNIIRFQEGNREHRPIKPVPEPVKKAPPCPDWLDDYAREIWADLGPRLEKLGLLTEVDGGPFGMYCMHMSIIRHAMESIEEAGGMAEYVKDKHSHSVPELQALYKSTNAVKAFLAEFGLTPSSRTRLSIEVPEEGTGDLD